MRTSRVTVIMVTYESRDIVDESMIALRSSHQAGIIDCIVVDNASSDDTAAFIEREHSWAKVIRSPTNLGYGRGCNLGLKDATTEYVLFMNPDVLLTANNLDILVRHMDTHPNAGIVAPAGVGPNGQLHVAGALPTPWQIIREAATQRRKDVLRRPIKPGGAAFRTDWVCGAVILVHADLMEQLGGFDPRFFLYFDETDLCYRARMLGAEVWAVGSAVAQHSGGASTRKTGERMFTGCISEHFFQSRYYYLVKHHGWIAASMAELLELMLMIPRELGRTLRGRGTGRLLARLQAPILSLPRRLDWRKD